MKFLKAITAIFSICAGLISCTEGKEGEQKTYTIQFTENPVMVGSNGGTKSVAFVSKHQWTAAQVDTWISDVSVADGEVTFTVAPNQEETPRDGKIRFTVSGDDFTKDLTVRQTGNTGKLSIETTKVAMETLGGEDEIKVTSGENWNVTVSSGDWLKATRKNSSTLLLEADVNFTGTKRETEVHVKTVSGKESVTVQVTQDADRSAFAGANTSEGRHLVYKTGGLISQVTSENVYGVSDGVKAIEMQFNHKNGNAFEPHSIFIFEVDLTKNVTILASCVNDDPASIKTTDKEVTATAPVRNHLHAMQNKRPELKVLCGVNGDFCYGQGSSSERNSLLHGVMHKDGKCLKSTFDGGTPCTVFAMMKDGSARILTQSEYAAQKSNIQEAVGGRQTLINKGQTVNFTDTRLEPRTAVGVSREGDKVYLLVVDGRRSGYSQGASYAVLAQIFQAYAVFDAINLDGGGSSTFLVNKASANKGFETRNRPTDSTGDRAVPNGLAVVRK